MVAFYVEESWFDPLDSSHHFLSKNEDLLASYSIYEPYRFTSLKSFKKICIECSRAIVEGETWSHYFGFTHVQMEDVNDIDRVRQKKQGLPNMTIMYDNGAKILIMKLVAGVPCEVAGRLFSKYLEYTIERHGLDMFALVGLKSSRFGNQRRSKEANEAYKPWTRNLECDWPSIVIEIGLLESIHMLKNDAHFWIANSGGETHIVILIMIDRIGKGITIQRWQNEPKTLLDHECSQTYTPTLMQSITLHDGISYIGPSLMIPTTLLFDVLPNGIVLGPNDFEITAQALTSYNQCYWRSLGYVLTWP